IKSRANQQQSTKEKSKGVFLTFRNGLSSFVEAIEKHLQRDSIRKQTTVTSVKKKGQLYEIHFDDGTNEEFDQVIITSPSHVTANILSDYSYFQYLKEMPATSVANVAMAFKEEQV